MANPPLTDRLTAARAVVMVVAAACCFGLSAVIAKVAFERGVPPIRLAQARVVVAFLLLFGLLAWRRPERLRPPPGSGRVLAAFGFAVAAVNASYYVAIDRLAVGVAISLQYTAPALLLGLSAATRRSRPGPLAWVAVALTLAGAVLVSQAVSGFAGVSGAGLVAASASSVFFAMYLLTAEAAGRRGAAAETVLFWGFVVAIVAWTVVAPWWRWPVERLGIPQVALAVVGVGVIGTLVPFLLVVAALRVLAPATAGIAATAEPPAAAAFAWVFLGQRLGALQLLGAGLVVGGVVLAHRMSVVRSDAALAVEPAP